MRRKEIGIEIGMEGRRARGKERDWEGEGERGMIEK